MDATAGPPHVAAATPDARPVRDRSDACPGALDAAPADDGLVARIRLPGGRVEAHQLRELAACAKELGTGSVDLTVRANLQIRGLSSHGVSALADRLAGVGLLPSPTHDRVRNIVASPFAGRTPGALVDAEALVVALDAAVCADPELAALSGRFQFAVDDGAAWPPATARHDVALVAVAPGTVALRLAGLDTGLRAASPDAAITLATSAAHAFLRASAASGAWHVRELPGGARELADLLTGQSADDNSVPEISADPPSRPPARGTHDFVGVLPQADGRRFVSALVPLGRLNARQLALLTDLAEHGLRLRVAPWRGVVVGDVPGDDVADLVAALDATGLPSDPASPWLGVSSCSGVGECRRAEADVRSLAREFVDRQSGGGPGQAVHFAACERACGRPPGAALVVVDADGVRPPPTPAQPERTPWTTG